MSPEEASALFVKLNEMELRRPRAFGDCWMGCCLWDKLQLSWFRNAYLAEAREEVPWAKVLQLLVVSRTSEPSAVTSFSSQ